MSKPEKEPFYNIDSYSDAELFSILDLNNPSDKELEARILFLIHKYQNMQNNSGNELVDFFMKMYNHFFDGADDEDNHDDELEEHDNIEEKAALFKDAPDVSNLKKNDKIKEPLDNATNKETGITPDPGTVTITKAVEYVKDQMNPILQQTIKRVISIDSQYRDDKNSLSTEFTFNLSDPLKDVVSLKLYSVQIPYTWYTIDTAFGSNFFYIKGNVPGINNGLHDYKIEIPAGNYSANELTVALNKSVKGLNTTHTDVSFGSTGVSYNPLNTLTTATIDITQQYNENSYYIAFSNWTNPNDVSSVRLQSIPGFLGYSYPQYYPYKIYSNVSLPVYREGTTTDDDIVRKYYVNESNNYITVIKYISIDRDGLSNLMMNPNTMPYDLSFMNVIDLTFKIKLSVSEDTTRTLLVNNLIKQIAACPYLSKDSGIVRKNQNIPLTSSGSYYEMTLKPDRYNTNNLSNSKLAVVFPFETPPLGYNPIWLGITSCFQFKNYINEFNTITSDVTALPEDVTSYVINSSPYIYLRCINKQFITKFDDMIKFNALGKEKNLLDNIDGTDPTILFYDGFYNNIPRDDNNNYITTNNLYCNDYIIPVNNSSTLGYSLAEYIKQINTSLANQNNYTINAKNITGDINTTYSFAGIDNNSTFHIQFDINKKFNQDTYMIDISSSYLFTSMKFDAQRDDLSGNNNVLTSIGKFFESNNYELNGEWLAVIKPSPNNYGNRYQNIYYVPVPRNPKTGTYRFDTYQDLQATINNEFSKFTDTGGNQPLTGTNLQLTRNPDGTINCTLTVIVQTALTEQDFSIQFIDPKLDITLDYYKATEKIPKNAAFIIDSSASYFININEAYSYAKKQNTSFTSVSIGNTKQLEPGTWFTDLSSAANSALASRLNNLDVKETSIYLLGGTSKRYYTSLNSLYLENPLLFDSTQNDDYMKPINETDNIINIVNSKITENNTYYTSINNVYNNDNKTLLSEYYVTINANNCFITGSNFTISSTIPIDVSIITINGTNTTFYLLDSADYYYYDSSSKTYAVDSRLIDIPRTSSVSITGETLIYVYITDIITDKTYMISPSNTIKIISSARNIQNYSNKPYYLMDSANYYYNDIATNTYYVDNSLIKYLSQKTLFFINNDTQQPYIDIVKSNNIRIIDSTKLIKNCNTDTFFIEDDPDNYYKNSLNQYLLNECDVYPVDSNYVFLIGNGFNNGNPITIANDNLNGNHIYIIDRATYSFNRVNSTNTNITATVNSVYILDSEKNYYKAIDNYEIDPELIKETVNTIYYIDNTTISGGNYYLYRYRAAQIYDVSSASVIYTQNSSKNIYVINSTTPLSKCYDTDDAGNIFIEETTFAMPDPLIIQAPNYSLYFVYNTDIINPSLIDIFGIVDRLKIIRVDFASAYRVETPLTFNKLPNYKTSSWYKYLNIAENKIKTQYDLSNNNQIDAVSGNYYSDVSGGTIDSNLITLTNNNNKIYLYPNEEGVETNTGANNIIITLPLDPNNNVANNKYTRQNLIKKINNSFTDTLSAAFGTFIVIDNEFTKFNININKIYTAKDHLISFYDPYSFVRCFVDPKTLQGSNIRRNATWDTTLGWILGYRLYTVYKLADYANGNKSIELVADACTSTTLYNSFMICLDDYNQSHLNDGLITITTKDTDISLPSYASRVNYQCDPVTGEKTYNTLNDSLPAFSNLTQNQIYSLTQIANSKTSGLMKQAANGSIVNSMTYGVSPFVQDVFAIIPLKLSGLQNGSFYVEYGGTLQNQDRIYFGPVNIHRMSVKLVSDKGNVLNLNGGNWSFCLICEQLYKQTGGSKDKK